MIRRDFIKNSALLGMGMGLSTRNLPFIRDINQSGKKIGMIGLDTSHSVAFTKELNVKKDAVYQGYKVVAAYPYGSRDIASSYERIPQYTKEVKEMGVKVVESIDALLKEVDVVMLETNDGKPHLEQALAVIKAGKPLFIDKPVAAVLEDVLVIYELANRYKVPIFSSSSLRYMSSAQKVRDGEIGAVLGADAYNPCTLEKSHTDLYWYGIHGVETLFTVMGKGCQQVTRTHTDDTDVVVGVWEDGRIGTFRGTRNGKHVYGGTAFGEKGNQVLGPYEGYAPLLQEIIRFFQTGQSPVDQEETIEIYTFMSAADESKLIGGGKVDTEEVLHRAYYKASSRLNKIIQSI